MSRTVDRSRVYELECLGNSQQGTDPGLEANLVSLNCSPVRGGKLIIYIVHSNFSPDTLIPVLLQ